MQPPSGYLSRVFRSYPHTLAACIYKKGPQTLTDAINEVEKLQAAQQLTATLLPSSTVNVMTNEGDQGFQCQELGHITCNCPNVHCFECNKCGHIAADCPDRIPPSGTPACHRRWHTRHHTRLTSRHHHWARHKYSRSGLQSYSHGYWSNSHDCSCRSHSQSHHRCPHRKTSQHHHSSTHHYCHDTHHIGNLHHIKVYQPTPEIAVDPEHMCHITHE